jgi:Flp pilus assembly protein TadD
MRLKSWLIATLILAFAAPMLADRRGDAKSQVEFGILVAKKGLWREALSRWQKAVELDPQYAQAWNDLAIGYEQLGQLTQARTAYDKAMELQPDNQLIKQNYDMFREIYDRQNRRRDK